MAKRITAVIGRLKGKTTMTVQSVIFAPKDEWTVADARAWLKDHDLKAPEVDETSESFRFRQREPSEFTAGSFRTIPFKGGKATGADQLSPVEGEKTMATRKFEKFIPFAKVDVPRREVWGIVTAEVPDKDDEVCDYAGSKPYYQAVIDEMGKATDGANYFPLRYMHQLEAIGKCIGFDFRDADKEIFMGFKVVDDEAWHKVTEKVLTGFSHGGSIVDMKPDPVYEGCKRYTADPSEISLVDNPCLATAHFTEIKADGTITLSKFKTVLPPQTGRLQVLEREIHILKARTGLDKTDESLDQRRTAVSTAVQEKYSEPGDTAPKNVSWAYLREFFDDHVVMEKDGKLWSVPYTIDDKQNVKLGDPVQVEVEYVPAGKAARPVAKAKTKRIAGEDLPASAFLIALDPERTETWNLPVKFSSEAKSKRHIRNALARFDQLKQVPQAEKDAAWKKLVALAGKYDINVTDEKAKLAAMRAWLRKLARTGVNRIGRTVRGGNVGYSLAKLDSELGGLAKGLGEVSQLASIIDQLAYILYAVTREEEREGDEASPIPDLLADNVDALLDTLLKMVEAEAADIREGRHAEMLGPGAQAEMAPR